MNTAAIATRANDSVRILMARTTGGLISARAPPTNPPTLADFEGTIKATANGHRDVEPQRASVEYVSDASKLLLPQHLFSDPTLDDTWNQYPLLDAVRSVYLTFATQLDATMDPNDESIDVTDVEPDPTADPPASMYGGPISTWMNHLGEANPSIYLQAGLAVGYLQPDMTVIPRSAALEACGAYIIFTWGPDVADDTTLILATPLEAGVASPANLAEAWILPTIRDQLSDHISLRMGLNVSFVDVGRMLDADMRWADAACNVRNDVARYRPKLTGYTTHMIAGLNVQAMGGNAMLAWYRAYCTSMGFLPSAGSVHNIEYQLTPQLCSTEEAALTSREHPSGAERQNVIRGAWSMLAAFGACHLANDHTWKPNDPTLQRKSSVYARACRTVMPAQLNAILSDVNNLQISMRTAMHPFGLSASIGAFYDGQALSTIAEPLRIRTTVVPPPVARIGTVVAVMDKLRALPVGAEIDRAYGEVIGRVRTLHTQVVAHALEYSDLHRHYAHAVQLRPTAAQMQDVNRLLPICAAYASTFDRRDDDVDIGSALSKTLMRVAEEDPGLVDLYERALQNYQDKVVDIAALLASATQAAVP